MRAFFPLAHIVLLAAGVQTAIVGLVLERGTMAVLGVQRPRHISHTGAPPYRVLGTPGGASIQGVSHAGAPPYRVVSGLQRPLYPFVQGFAQWRFVYCMQCSATVAFLTAANLLLPGHKRKINLPAVVSCPMLFTQRGCRAARVCTKANTAYTT